MSKGKVPLDDLAYELQLLLGASKIIDTLERYDSQRLADDRKMGNLVNYFKDSAYVHIRNLYNFFSANTQNDAKVTEYIKGYSFNLTMYRNWKGALHDHALHIKAERKNTPRSNAIGGRHLNEMVPDFTNDILKLWQDWIDNTTDKTLEKKLIKILDDAKKATNDDVDKVTELLK